MRWIEKLRVAWGNLQVVYCRYLGRNYQCGCGHTVKWKMTMTIHGRSGVFKIPNRNPDYCLECYAKAAIRCAWCGEPIMPGDPITLYIPKENFEVPEHAVVYKREPRLQLVGCLGWNCADTGADRAGFWIMPGKVKRVMSPIEELMANGFTEAVVIGDLTDPSEATPIPDEES